MELDLLNIDILDQRNLRLLIHYELVTSLMSRDIPANWGTRGGEGQLSQEQIKQSFIQRRPSVATLEKKKKLLMAKLGRQPG